MFKRKKNLNEEENILTREQIVEDSKPKSKLDKYKDGRAEVLDANSSLYKADPNEKKKIKRSSPLQVATEAAVNYITKGELDIQQSPFEITYNKIMAEKHCKQVFQIIELPERGVIVGFADNLRLALKKKFTTIEEQGMVDVIFVQSLQYNPQNLSSRKLKSNEKISKKQINNLLVRKQEMENPIKGLAKVSPELAAEAKTDKRLQSSLDMLSASREDLHNINRQLSKQRKKVQSFQEVDLHQQSGGTCVDAFMFFEVIGVNSEITSRAAEYFRELLADRNYVYREIKDLLNYQKSFSLASLKTVRQRKGISGLKSKGLDVVPFFTTSTIPAVSQAFKPGIIRSKHCELYVGNNVENNYRFDISLTDSGAENWVVFAQTGAGKSATFALSLLTALDNEYMSVLLKDYKGNEWSVFTKLFDKQGVVISMGADSGKFVNPYRIPDYRKFGFSNPSTTYTLSHTIAVKMLSSLVDQQVGQSTINNICGDIVKSVFLRKGILFDSYDTYKLSQKINFKDDTWIAIENMTRDSELVNKFGADNFKLVKASLAPYFSPKGDKRSFFGEEIDLDSVIFGKRVIDFDMNNRGVSGSLTRLDKEIACSLLQQVYIERLFCSVQKMNNKFTVILTEEVQEYFDKGDGVLQELITSARVGRSENVVNIMVMNTIGEFLNAKKGPLHDLKETITGYVIGKCEKDTVKQIINTVGITNMSEMLENISASQGKYKHAFMFYSKLHRFDTVVARMPVTEDLIQSVLPSRTKLNYTEDYSF